MVTTYTGSLPLDLISPATSAQNTHTTEESLWQQLHFGEKERESFGIRFFFEEMGYIPFTGNFGYGKDITFLGSQRHL